MNRSWSEPGWPRNLAAALAVALVIALSGTAFLRADGGNDAGSASEGTPPSSTSMAPNQAPDEATEGSTGADVASGEPPVVGVQFHGTWTIYNDRERAETLDRLVELGAEWIRMDISWAGLEPSGPGSFEDSYTTKQVDRIVEMADERGLKVLGMLWLTPDWADPTKGERSPPADPRDYARALARAADRWQGTIPAWQVWNEPNLDIFFAGQDPQTYTDLLCASYDAVQRGGSDARVVFGATVHNDVEWIGRAYDAGMKGCFDVLATHPYGAPADAPPSAGTSEIYELGSVSAVHDLMVSQGDRKPIWATELGWSSHENTGDEPNHMRGVTEQQQADYTVQALDILRRDHPYVKQVFIYNARDRVTEDYHQNGFGILNRDMTPKPVYDALQAWIGG